MAPLRKGPCHWPPSKKVMVLRFVQSPNGHQGCFEASARTHRPRAEPQELAETSVQRFFNHPTRNGAPELDTGRANAGRRERSPKERPRGGLRLGGLALSKAKQEN